METKRCKRCEEVKPLDDFYFRDDPRYKKRYYAEICKVCNTIKLREYRAANRDKVNEIARVYQIKKKYKLTSEEYQDLIKDGCMVCGDIIGLAIDHDHSCCPGKTTCGKCVRGALCRRHNWAVGNLNDSAEEADAVATYLRMTRI